MFGDMHSTEHPLPAHELRARAEALRRRSQDLRLRSIALLGRREATVHKLQIRRETLHTEFQQMRAMMRSTRAELAHANGDLQDWMVGEVLEMVAAGWTRPELAEVGIGPDLLRELRLHGHPTLRDAG
jgi:hypothetical protein